MDATKPVRMPIAIAALTLLPGACARDSVPRAGGEEGPASAAPRADALFRGGLVHDGSGSEPFVADVLVRAGRIAFVGDAAAAGLAAADTFDATGLWVAPGFIDMHTHAELEEEWGRDAVTFLYQGVTTVVSGADGGGPPDIAAQMQRWRTAGTGVNVLTYVGHNAIRRQVMGLEARAPTAQELDAMKALVRAAMDEGALGLSTGLFYTPGTYATTEEVIELAKVAAAYPGAIYDTHDRDLGAVYQGIGFDASVAEAMWPELNGRTLAEVAADWGARLNPC